jgi:hypothetical protein
MKSSRHVVLLGAGASVPLGLPTMTELADTFEQSKLDNKKYLNRICKARVTIQRNDFTYDVESLYTFFHDCADPCAALRRAGPYAASICPGQPISTKKKDDLADGIAEQIEEHIIKKCYVSDDIAEEKTRIIYNRFFSKITGIKTWKKSIPKWNSNIFEVFTTNYDNAVENYGSEIGQDPCLGRILSIGDRIIFRPELYDDDSFKIKLYKLHGSVELSLLEDGSIVANYPPKSPGDSQNGIQIRAKIMVYGPEKNLIAEPYFDLLFRFKQRLKEAKRCFVVGYSFRDPWINQIFVDVLRVRTDLRIEYISPTATYRSSQLPFLSSCVHPIDQTFEQYLELPEGYAK